MNGTWTTTGGAVLSTGGVAVVIGAVVAFAERRTIGQALSEAVTVAEVVMAVMVAAVPVAVVFLVRHNRRKGAELAAMFAARHAKELAAIEARELRNHQARLEDHQRALEVAAASAPVIQNHVHLGALADLVRGYAPATVIHDREIQ